MKAIEIKKIKKNFNGLMAVNDISFNVREGELFGLLGPNGAGKTTLIKMLATLTKPTSGSAQIWGYNILDQQDEVRRSIGIVFQEPALDDKLTGRENLDFHTRMYDMKKEIRKKRINEVLELVELKEKEDILVEKYSGGMKRRLEIARGLMHYPKVLFLDEPTLGLDPQTRRHIWDYIKKLNKQEKVTVILTTHYMEEADYLCERVAIVDKGKIMALDKLENLKDLIGEDIISLKAAEVDRKNLKNVFEAYDWVKSVKESHEFLDLSVEVAEKKVVEVVNIARQENINIESINLRKPTLEDVFLHFTGKTIREREASAKDAMHQRIRMRHRK